MCSKAGMQQSNTNKHISEEKAGMQQCNRNNNIFQKKRHSFVPTVSMLKTGRNSLRTTMKHVHLEQQ